MCACVCVCAFFKGGLSVVLACLAEFVKKEGLPDVASLQFRY